MCAGERGHGVVRVESAFSFVWFPLLVGTLSWADVPSACETGLQRTLAHSTGRPFSRTPGGLGVFACDASRVTSAVTHHSRVVRGNTSDQNTFLRPWGRALERGRSMRAVGGMLTRCAWTGVHIETRPTANHLSHSGRAQPHTVRGRGLLRRRQALLRGGAPRVQTRLV